jgi:cytochrome c oxidase assembly protein subunit 15
LRWLGAFLICIGGMVTSNNAGMSVPDWPNSYGYNMFFFPWQDWVGGIFFEHSHRLAATGVGTLTIVLAIWLCFQERVWLRWVGGGAVVFVLLQGVIGGLRVIWKLDWLGVPHALLAQSYFVYMVAHRALHFALVDPGRDRPSPRRSGPAAS